MKPFALNKCPVPACPHAPRPLFCMVHWPFISPDVRTRIASFAKMFRGGRDAAPPPTLLRLLRLALTDIRTSPFVRWNWADRLAVLLHRLVVGGAR